MVLPYRNGRVGSLIVIGAFAVSIVGAITSRQIEVRDNSSSPRSFIISHPLRPYPTSPEKTRWLYYPDSPQQLRDFAQTIYCTEEFHNEWENRRNYTLVSFSQSANV